jgi:hypothetical protein
MSIYEKSQPASIDDFRRATLNSNMSGVMNPTFRCAKCRTSKRTRGRKPVSKTDKRAGYVCADCQNDTVKG